VLGDEGSVNFAPRGKFMMLGFATYAVACLDCGYLGTSLTEEDRCRLQLDTIRPAPLRPECQAAGATFGYPTS